MNHCGTLVQTGTISRKASFLSESHKIFEAKKDISESNPPILLGFSPCFAMNFLIS